MTFSLNNYAPRDSRLAQAKLWEGAFLETMRAFQQRTAGRFQVTFMAEVGFRLPASGGAGDPGGFGGSPCPPPGPPHPGRPWACSCPRGRQDPAAWLGSRSLQVSGAGGCASTALPGGRDQSHHGPGPAGLRGQLHCHLPVHLPGPGQLLQLAPGGGKDMEEPSGVGLPVGASRTFHRATCRHPCSGSPRSDTSAQKAS